MNIRAITIIALAGAVAVGAPAACGGSSSTKTTGLAGVGGSGGDNPTVGPGTGQ